MGWMALNCSRSDFWTFHPSPFPFPFTFPSTFLVSPFTYYISSIYAAKILRVQESIGYFSDFFFFEVMGHLGTYTGPAI